MLRRTSLGLAVLCSIPAFALTAQTAGPPAVVAALDSLAQIAVTSGGLPGLSLAVVQDGRVLLARGYGKARLAPDQPASATTMFAVGSVTKEFTCAAVLLLQEAGKLSVHDPVAKWYPGLTRADEITLLDLMNHVSGYPDYYPLDFVDRRMRRPIATEELIRRYGGGALDFPPGTRWSYSNTGYIILGRIVERVSGEPFGAFLARRIFRPLGMTHTRYEPDPAGSAFAKGYTSFALGPPEPAVYEARGWTASAGGIWSTAEDLVKWDLALMGGRVLRPGSMAILTTPRRLADGASTGYGGGLGIRRRDGWTIWSHGGAVAGFLAGNLMVPGSRSAVAMLTNGEHGAALGALRQAAVAAFTAGTPPADSVPADSTAPPAPPPIPAVAGPPASEVATALFHGLQTGQVDRAMLGEEYSVFLTPEKLRGAAERLGPLGEPDSIAVVDRAERGGMEVAVVAFHFPQRGLTALMYRTPDGKVQEFLVSGE
jgi:CubicO group peptidase (beta-lactamase class C family)